MITQSPLDVAPEDFSLEDLFDSGFFGSSGSAALFVDEEMGAPPELVSAGHSGRSDGRGVTEDDFEEDEESEAFLRVKKSIRTACNINTKGPARKRAIEWIFIPNKEDKDGLTFELCCNALQSRGDLLRVRLQHQLFDSHIIIEPLPFAAFGIPQMMRSEIEYLCKPGSLRVAAVLWENPGIRLDALVSRLDMSPSDIEPIILSLEKFGYAGFWLGHGWFIGKNPLIMPRSERLTFKWSGVVL